MIILVFFSYLLRLGWGEGRWRGGGPFKPHFKIILVLRIKCFVFVFCEKALTL